MPGSGTGTFIDSDDYQESLSHLRIDLLVTAQGAFKARLTWATLHLLRLLRSQDDLPRIAYVSLDPALIFVALSPNPSMLSGGLGLQRNEIIFHSRRDGHQPLRLAGVVSPNAAWLRVHVSDYDAA